MCVRTRRTFDGLDGGPELQAARLDVHSLAGRGLNLELNRVARLELDAFGNRGHAKLVRLSVDIVCGTEKKQQLPQPSNLVFIVFQRGELQ
jgi:hypothetical protein